MQIVLAAISGANFLTQRREARKQEGIQRESNAVSNAQSQTEDRAARRRAAREERLRRARIVSLSRTSGGGGSSGEVGSVGALTSNTGAAIAGQRQGARTNESLSILSQQFADSRGRAASFQAFTDLAGSAYQLRKDYLADPTGGR